MKILMIPFLFISFYVYAQVVPIGTVIIGKRLPTLTTNSTSYMHASFATLRGSIKINDSKLAIMNPCETNPCKNGGACSFDFESTIITCECIEPFGGDCCAAYSNNYGGNVYTTSGTNTCNAYFQQIASSKKNQKFKLNKFDENLVSNYNWFVLQVINTQSLKSQIGK